MLKFASQMDEDTRIKCYMAGWLAVDENCGELGPKSQPIRLVRSKGRSKAGNPAKYYIFGLTIGVYSRTPMIKAFSDDDALDIANKFLAQFPKGG